MPERPIELPATLQRVPHLAQRRLGDEVVVMDLREGKLYGFNVEAGELLDWLKAGQSSTSLRAIGAPGLEEFLGILVERGLIGAVEGEAVGESGAAPVPASLLGSPPKLLWQEEAARVTNQTSPPQAITNPQCQP